MPEPLKLKTTELRHDGMRLALDQVKRGGTVHIYHYKTLVAVMIPPGQGDDE